MKIFCYGCKQYFKLEEEIYKTRFSDTILYFHFECLCINVEVLEKRKYSDYISDFDKKNTENYKNRSVLAERACEYCNRVYKPSRSTQKYCSKDCTMKALNKKRKMSLTNVKN